MNRSGLIRICGSHTGGLLRHTRPNSPLVPKVASTALSQLAAPIKKESMNRGPKEFEISAKGVNPAFNYVDNKELENTMKSFQGLGLQNNIVLGLENMQISQPTVIQMKAIPKILKGSSVFCAAQTGSGKTLAYVAPILNNLKLAEEDGFLPRFNRPRVCIVSPFRELASQILKVVKTMSIHAPVRSLGLIGGEKDHIMYRGLREKPVDIVVGTPGTILALHAKKKLFFTDLSHLVFDEADTMLDTTFKEMTNQFLQSMKNRSVDKSRIPTDIQCIFAAAILPGKSILNTIKSSILKLKIVTAELHHVLPHVRHKFMKTSQTGKPQLLLECLMSKRNKDRKMMIFVNSSSTCKWLSGFLEEHGIAHNKLSGKIPPEDRANVFERYNKDPNGILVCTDIAARGLDSPDLFSVFNYDCPLNPTDYIHRAGRTGRARANYSGTPEVLTFLTRNWELNLAKTVQLAAERKAEIENVDIVRRKMVPIVIKK